MYYEKLSKQARLLMEADLEPIQGQRFQPTGFPDLGAATYQGPDGSQMLLVESCQSMANRLEAVCWDSAVDDVVGPLRGMPFVRAHLPDGVKTTSIQEAHRLNSPYIVNSPEFAQMKQEVGFKKDQPFDPRNLYKFLFKYDPCSLLHGVFLEKIGGVVRLPRALSAFIEARDVQPVLSGGVKFDRVQPASTGDKTKYGKAAEGYGNVPFSRQEYTAGSITAFFNLDLVQIRNYGLPEAAQDFLILLALFKIRKFLAEGLRLRTACDLKTKDDIRVTAPEGFTVSSLDQLSELLPQVIEKVAKQGLFAEPPVTVVHYESKHKKAT